MTYRDGTYYDGEQIIAISGIESCVTFDLPKSPVMRENSKLVLDLTPSYNLTRERSDEELAQQKKHLHDAECIGRASVALAEGIRKCNEQRKNWRKVESIGGVLRG